MPRKSAAEPDPNKLVRRQAGTYRTADDRFEAREGGTGWYLVDREQTNELGQELVHGPFTTLNAIRDAIPDARRTTIRSLPAPRRALKPAGGVRSPRSTSRSEPKPKPKPPDHRLVRLLREAARGRFPRGDLGLEVVGPPPGPSDAIVAFSGHSVIAVGVDPDEVFRHLPDADPGAPMSAPFLTWLGLQLGTPPGSVDVVLVADGTGTPDRDRPLEPVDETDPALTERVERARRYRSEVRLYADADRSGVVIVGRGLAGRLEVSLEVQPGRRGRGIGAALARAATGLAPESEPLYAQVAPGNVASVRAFLRAGYRPIGSEVLFLRPG